MPAKFKKGDTAYFVESNYKVREVQILNTAGGLYLIKFDNGGGIRVKEHRLFSTKEEAEATLPKKEPTKRKMHWDYM